MHIGELAERTGLSLRTLRHYDEIGLVTPSGRTDGGFRLYTADDEARVMLIRRMKPLGYSLDQMRELLDLINLVNANPRDPELDARFESVRQEALERRDRLESNSPPLRSSSLNFTPAPRRRKRLTSVHLARASLDPDQSSGETDRGAVVAGEFVGAHRDPAPLLEPVEAPLNHVATLVASLLLVAEVDRPTWPLPAVRDLVVTLRDGRSDPAAAKPGAVRLRRVALVGKYPVRAGSGPTLPARGTRMSSRTAVIIVVSFS